MIKNKTKYIGIDIGGTKTLIQTFDRSLRPIESKAVKTQTHKGLKGFWEQLTGLIDEFYSRGVKGIGVVVPGIVNQKNGSLIQAPHLPTGKDLKLKSLLEKRYGTSVHVDNDINGFLAAEYEKSSLNKHQNVLAIMLGTGLGGAAIVNGEMLYGKDGFAGEFGHMMINRHGSFEQSTSGHYLKKSPKLKKDLVANFGLGLSNLNLIFNPSVIVLGGSIYHHHLSGKKKQLERIIKKHSLANQSPKLIDAGSRTSAAKGAVLLLKKATR